MTARVTKASSPTPTISATVVFLVMFMACPSRGGTVVRSACGRMTRRKVSKKPKPSECAASACPGAMPRMPLRMSSEMKAAAYRISATSEV